MGVGRALVRLLSSSCKMGGMSQRDIHASKKETKGAKKARREETVRTEAVQEEMGLIAMRVFEKLLARESAEGTIDGSSQIERASCDVSTEPDCLPVGLSET